MSGLRQRGVGCGGGLDLQPAIADDQLACEMQGRREARRSECPLGRDGHASDPKPAQAFVVGALSYPRKQRAQHAPTPKRLERKAVPDVGLARAWRDLQIDPSAPFCPGVEPTLPRSLTPHPSPTPPTPPRQPTPHA